MRNTYPLVVLLFVCSGQHVLGQAYGELDINNVRARFYANGRVSRDTITGPHFEVPLGSGAMSLYTGGLWIAGQATGGQTRVSKSLYDSFYEMDFYPGPLTNDGSASITQQVSDQYNHVWKVTRTEILTHLSYFDCLNDPNCDVAIEFPGGYTIPAAFLDWPAMGDVSEAQDLYLAPFFDFNADGQYDPTTGDSPCILGDQALYYIFNDHLGTQAGHVPLGIEVRAMPFVYSTGGSALDGTVFVHYHMINQSSQTYTNTMLGFFNDFELGCADDDFIGSDPSRNLAYVYNWDDDDQNCNGAMGYGTQPPAFGMVLLKGPLVDPNALDDPASNVLPNWNGQGFGDGIIDNERFGLEHFMYFNRNTPDNCCNDPYLSTDYYNYLRGIWKDGLTMTYGGTGYSVDPGAVQCSFMYPGSDDPVGAGTGGVVQAPWSETVPTPAAPDRRGLMSMGPMTMEPGEHMDLFFAYVYARAATGGALASVAALQARVDSVRAFASTLPIWNTMEEEYPADCEALATVGVREALANTNLALFPVPASDLVRMNVPTALAGEPLRVHDATGRVVGLHQLVSGMNEIDISALAPGIYSCSVVAERTRHTGRLVKE
ncbi:MAG: T9SS type A sorting domain-containing protein [Flavobacteriales bacterium]|nr:T9SS type A sorting domain-containing protein [Flavobacteriales bacterium]